MTKSIPRIPSTGFSLVELMVGIAIGLVTVLVASQVLTTSMARNRATAAGADNMVNATLGLYTIERDAKNAGFGLTSVRSGIGCPIHAKYGDEARDFTLVPVVITDGANGAPDTIRLLASAKNNFPMPIRIVTHNESAANFFVESALGVENGDMMIAVPAELTASNWCTLFQVSAPDQGATPGQGGNQNNGNGHAYGQNQIRHAPGQSEWNQPGGHNLFPTGGYLAGDYLLNLGNFVDRRYSIVKNELVLTTYHMPSNTPPNPQPIYPHIVQLQAVYGKDTNGDGTVDEWNATAPTNSAQWRQIIALRVALVARSANMESDDVTLPGSYCNSASPPPTAVCWRPDPGGNGVAIDVNINNENPNWQRFRYRVMETTIPLRNAIWFQ